MASVNSPWGDAELQTGYAAQRAQMELLAGKSGIKPGEEIKAEVGNQRSHAESRINDEKSTANSSENSTKTEYNRLQSEHEQGNENFSHAKKAEEERQDDWAGGNENGRKNLINIKDDLKKKFDQK